MMSDIGSEFIGGGLINKFVLKYISLILAVVITTSFGYVYTNELKTHSYLINHQSDHEKLKRLIENKLNQMIAQIKVNRTVAEVDRLVSRKEYQRYGIKENLAEMERVIERLENVPDIYFKDRDRYRIELEIIETEIFNLNNYKLL